MLKLNNNNGRSGLSHGSLVQSGAGFSRLPPNFLPIQQLYFNHIPWAFQCRDTQQKTLQLNRTTLSSVLKYHEKKNELPQLKESWRLVLSKRRRKERICSKAKSHCSCTLQHCWSIKEVSHSLMRHIVKMWKNRHYNVMSRRNYLKNNQQSLMCLSYNNTFPITMTFLHHLSFFQNTL